jgi:hypothetical protein
MKGNDETHDCAKIAKDGSKSPNRVPLTRGERDQNAKDMVARLPAVTDTEWRLACMDVAEALAKHAGFRWRVIGLLILATAALVTTASFAIQYVVQKQFEGKLAQITEDADKKVGDANRAIAKQLTAEFKDERIQELIQKAAAGESRNLLSQAVQPSINSFRLAVENQRKEITRVVQESANARKEIEAAQQYAKGANETASKLGDAIKSAEAKS